MITPWASEALVRRADLAELRAATAGWLSTELRGNGYKPRIALPERIIETIVALISPILSPARQ